MGQFIVGVVVGVLLVIALFTGRFFVWFQAHMRKPDNSPSDFLMGGRGSAHKVIVCVGDSITHGIVSANYVEMLEHRFAKDRYTFVNAGINGNLAYNVLQRLNDIIACKPDVATLLIGTNDVNATFNQEWEDTYRKEQHITQKPSFEWFRQNLEQIIDRLQTETEAKIAVLSLPVVGEQLDSEINQRVNVYNAALREIAAAKQITYLPLHEQLSALLPEHHNPPAYHGIKSRMYESGFKYYIQQKSWNKVSAESGLALLTDHLHLNEKAAGVIAGLVGDFLDELS